MGRYGIWSVYIQSGNDKVTHLSVPDQDDSYALSDNAIYSLCRDKEMVCG